MPEPERPAFDPLSAGAHEAIAPTGQGGAMDLALEEAESLEKELGEDPPDPRRRPAPCGPTPGTNCAATPSSSSPAC